MRWHKSNLQLTLGRVVVGLRPIAVKSDTDFPFLNWLELFPVELDGIGMCDDDTVANTVCKSFVSWRVSSGG
jgi:hypothetical protein